MGYRIRCQRWLSILCLILMSGCATAYAHPLYLVPRVTIAQVTDLGPIGYPAHVLARDAGISGLLGPTHQILWSFGDTLLEVPATDGANLRTNTCALASVPTPLTTQEPLDAHGDPAQCIPFTADELAYNQSKNNPNDRIALWPGGLLPGFTGTNLLIFNKIHVLGALNFVSQGIGFALIKPGWTHADREPTLLFTPPDPDLQFPMLSNGMVYLYGAISGTTNVTVARVPWHQVTLRSSYQFWNGTTWSSDATQAASIMTFIPGGISVFYDAYLGQYLAVHSAPFSNNIVYRLAPAPEGPWSAPTVLFTGQTPGTSGNDYAAIAHVELSSTNGKTIVVTYAHPLGTFTLELRYVQVTFG